MGQIQMKTMQEFTLNKVKLKKDNMGLSTEFQMESESDQGFSVIDCTNNCNQMPQPGLIECFDQLKPIIAYSAGLMGPAEELLSKKNMLLDKKVKPEALETKLETYKKDVLENVQVTTVHFQHKKEEGYTVIITGGYIGPLGFSVHNTPMISLDEEKHGFEEQALETLENLRTEVFKYVVKGKRAQLDAFDEEEDSPKKETKEEAEKVA